MLTTRRKYSFGRRFLSFISACTLLLSVCGELFAQAPPTVFFRGVVNAASALRVELPGSAIAQGSLFSIFGQNLGPQQGVSVDGFPLAPNLAGVSIEIFNAEGSSVAALPIFVRSDQINAVLPSQTPPGVNFVRVSFNGVAGNSVDFKVVRHSFGIFTWTSSLIRNAIAQKSGSQAGPQLVTYPSPALPGQVITLWGTGLGAIETPDSQPPLGGNIGAAVEVLVGGALAEVTYAGRSPCCAGLDQINFLVPDDAPVGCLVPIAVRTGGSNFSNVAPIALSNLRGAEGAREALPCWLGELAGVGPVPEAPAARISLNRNEGGRAAPFDEIIGLFRTPNTQPAAVLQNVPGAVVGHRAGLFGVNDPAMLPPLGSCLTYTPPVEPSVSPAILELDAGGSFIVSTPTGFFSVPRGGDGVYRAGGPGSDLVLNPTSFSISAQGGSGFPAFSATLQAHDPLTWTNRNDLTPFFRLNGLDITWDPRSSSAERLIIEGQITDDGISGEIPGLIHFLCTADPSIGSFRIPPYAIANVPGTRAEIRFITASGPSRLEFLTDGLESGLVDYRHTAAAQALLWTAYLASTPLTLPNGSSVHAELAANAAEQRVGYMNRPEIPVGNAMLFLYTSMGFRPFWMYTTLAPLDIIWIDSDRRVVFVSENTPPCPPGAGLNCPLYGGQVQSQYVLELPAGQAAATGVMVGASIDW